MGLAGVLVACLSVNARRLGAVGSNLGVGPKFTFGFLRFNSHTNTNKHRSIFDRSPIVARIGCFLGDGDSCCLHSHI